MQKVKVAAASFNTTPLAFEQNRDQIIKVIEMARKQQVSILCCPELCITGYGCEDQFLAKSTTERALKSLYELLPHTQAMGVAVGLPVRYQGNLYNGVCWIWDGKIQGFVLKQNLPSYGVYYEPRWFQAWSRGVVSSVELPRHDRNNSKQNDQFPLGDLVFEHQGFRLGFEICEDAWVPERTGNQLFEREVDLILNPSASHFVFGKSVLRKRCVLEGAKLFGVGYVYANLLGNEAGRILYEGDTLIAADDTLLASGPRLSFQDAIVTSAEIDIQALRSKRKQLKETRKKEETTQKTSKTFTTNKDSKPVPPDSSWEQSEYRREEEFTRAVALGLFDYLRKSHSFGFVLNLSGGADSAACACLVYLMVQLALQELGNVEFQKKLSYIPAIQTLSPEDSSFSQQILKELLFCLYQKTINNSAETQDSAKYLASALSCSYATITIDSLVADFQSKIEPVIGRSLQWERDGITLQNIQSRVRSPSLWMLANIRNALVICTNNRSEASVGYATMDGDTAGSLCPIAGVSKSFILSWLRWLEKEGVYSIGNIPALHRTTVLEPSAELKPLEQNQRDENDLMPYVLLDQIEHYFVRERLSSEEILEQLLQKNLGYDIEYLEKCIDRFLKLWSRAQWKRERLAPSFHLDEESVDPKTWCRYPIL